MMEARLVQLHRAAGRLQERLLAESLADGHWTGELSSSALATAVAAVALTRVDARAHDQAIGCGLQWLAGDCNADGGWGDSPDSASNLSTTLLVWSALGLAEGRDHEATAVIQHCERWLNGHIDSLQPPAIASAVLSFYGDDRTFSAPILLLLALAGRLGAQPRWDLVPQLPLELAALPQTLFRWARLPVVSYAMPALIAIGLARHRQAPSANLLLRWLRSRITGRVLRLLQQIQPNNGGFLEAVPLTAFVVMSLSAAGLAGHPVTAAGVRFLLASQRDDGSWPIDTNLATWITTLAVNAITAGDGGMDDKIPDQQRRHLCRWLLDQQLVEQHPFTRAAAGGWAWTDLPGGVPDADDTAGALLALYHLNRNGGGERSAAARGIDWLLDLQNRDGGLPTFCRGWGKLPFDRSCPDITAHGLRAFAAWQGELDGRRQRRCERAIDRGIGYLARVQRDDGAWVPLWFGNQWAAGGENPVYGTAQVVSALQYPGLRQHPAVVPLLERGGDWLRSQVNRDGGWGHAAGGVGSSVEETALALSALAEIADGTTLTRGTAWLMEQILPDGSLPPAPIGLYFASLWYSDRLYPLVFAVGALNRVITTLQSRGHRGQKQVRGKAVARELRRGAA